MINPLAGDGMRSRTADEILGISMPLAGSLMSSIAVLSACVPIEVLMATPLLPGLGLPAVFKIMKVVSSWHQ